MNVTTNMLRIALLSLTVSLGTAMAEPTSSAPPPMIQIDKIEVSGATTMTPDELAPYLDLPLGQDISLITASEHLSEAIKILVATGKFKDNMQLKLERSFKSQHYIIKANIEDLSSRYLGVRGSYARYEPDAYFNRTYDRYRSELYGLNFYWGDRDFNRSGWGLDLDVKGTAQRIKYSELSNTGTTHSESKGKDQLDLAESTITTINQNILSGRGYTGLELKSGIGTFSSDATKNRTDTDVVDEQYSWGTDFVQHSAEPFAGVKIGKTSLAAGVRRTMNRDLKLRKKAIVTKNGEPQAADITYGAEGRVYWFYTRSRLSASYTDKPRLNLVEPGIDVRANLSREYYEFSPGPPILHVNGEYTWFAQSNVALTCLQSSSWFFQDRQWQRSLRRQHELGLRIDYITQTQFVVYGEFTRFGGLRREIAYSEHFDGLTLKSHAEIGVIHASSDMLYGLSFVYLHARPTTEDISGTSLGRSSGLDRLGGR